MLQINVVLSEKFDSRDNEFIIEEFFELRLEHSLLSMSKWEAFFEKPFLSKEEKTSEEFIAYIQAMILNPTVPSNLFEKLTQKNIKEIADYIDSRQSATTVRETAGNNSEIITTEVIYSWLVMHNIPWTPTETWHVNRLLNLVKIVVIKSQPPKKMSRQEIARRNKALNDQRRKEFGTSG